MKINIRQKQLIEVEVLPSQLAEPKKTDAKHKRAGDAAGERRNLESSR
jgi:hypothetical protein